MTYDLEDLILRLGHDNRWTEILELLTKNRDDHARRKFLWIVPQLNDIGWLKEAVSAKGMRGIVSVGCGSGLLERIIQEQSGLEVIGVEVDRKWWHSNYSPPLFIKNVVFADEFQGDIPFLRQTNYALLFCYFNNERAFLNYMREYEGDQVIVIGPSEGQNRHTNPMPYDYKFGDNGWRLFRVRHLVKSKDLIAIYVRFRKKTFRSFQ